MKLHNQPDTFIPDTNKKFEPNWSEITSNGLQYMNEWAEEYAFSSFKHLQDHAVGGFSFRLETNGVEERYDIVIVEHRPFNQSYLPMYGVINLITNDYTVYQSLRDALGIAKIWARSWLHECYNHEQDLANRAYIGSLIVEINQHYP